MRLALSPFLDCPASTAVVLRKSCSWFCFTMRSRPPGTTAKRSMISAMRPLDARLPVLKMQIRMPGQFSSMARTNMATDTVLPKRRGVCTSTSARIVVMPIAAMTRSAHCCQSAP